MVQLGHTGRHLLLSAAVSQGHGVGAQTQRGAGGIHGHVAAAKDHDVLAVLDGGVKDGEVHGLHEVHAGEVLVGAEDAGKVLAGDVQELGQAGAHSHVHGVVAHVVEELVAVVEAAHHGVVLELDA